MDAPEPEMDDPKMPFEPHSDEAPDGTRSGETAEPTLLGLPDELKLALIRFLYCDLNALFALAGTCKATMNLIANTPGVVSEIARRNFGVGENGPALEKMPFLTSPSSRWTPFTYFRRVLVPHGRLIGLWHGDVPAYAGRFLQVSLDPSTGNIIGIEREPNVPEAIGPRGQPGAMPITKQLSINSINTVISVDVLLDNPEFAADVARRGGVLFSVIASGMGLAMDDGLLIGRIPVNCHGIRAGTWHARAFGPSAGATLHPVRITWQNNASPWSSRNADDGFDPAKLLSRLLGLAPEADADPTRALPEMPFGLPDDFGVHRPPRASAIPHRLQFTAGANKFLPLADPETVEPTGVHSPNDTFMVSCPVHSPLPVIAILPSGDTQGAAYQTRFSRIILPTPGSTSPLREGIWLGTYGGHGCEYLLCRPGPEGAIEFVKLTGDVNVPRGAVSLCLVADPSRSPRRIPHGDGPNFLDLSLSTEYGSAFEDGKPEPAMFRGWATVALSGYSMPSRIEATGVMMSSEDLVVIWHELDNVGRMRWVG